MLTNLGGVTCTFSSKARGGRYPGLDRLDEHFTNRTELSICYIVCSFRCIHAVQHVFFPLLLPIRFRRCFQYALKLCKLGAGFVVVLKRGRLHFVEQAYIQGQTPRGPSSIGMPVVPPNIRM
jgi:hypothetical protein